MSQPLNPNRSLLYYGENYTGHDAKSAMELEAESVAFIILQHFGVDSGDYSFGYISHWVASGSNDLEPVIAQLKQSGVKIQKATNEIINAISDSLNAIVVDNNDDIFQIDLAEFLTARREMANAAIASLALKAINAQQDKVLALASN
jgi:hypothetical protein